MLRSMKEVLKDQGPRTEATRPKAQKVIPRHLRHASGGKDQSCSQIARSAFVSCCGTETEVIDRKERRYQKGPSISCETLNSRHPGSFM